MMCTYKNRGSGSLLPELERGKVSPVWKLQASGVIPISQVAGDGCSRGGCGTNSYPLRAFATFRSKTGLEIGVMEFSESHFKALVDMYDAFEPKRAAQGLPPVGRERIDAWLRHLQRSGFNLLAFWNGRLIGHSMLCPVDPQRAEFAIFLCQAFRNQGIGTGLTEATLTYARQKRLRRVWLSVEVNNQPAIRVYRKMGFKVCGLFGPEQEMDLELEKSKGNEVNVREPAA